MCQLSRYGKIQCDGNVTTCVRCHRQCCLQHSTPTGGNDYRFCLYCRDNAMDTKLLNAADRIGIASRKADPGPSLDNSQFKMERP